MKKIVLWIMVMTFGLTTLMANESNYTLESLTKEIKNSSKPTVVYFRKNSCASCDELEKYTFTNKSVQEILKNFTFIKVDVGDFNRLKENKKILKKFNLFGTPSMVFFDKNHIEQDEKLVGFQTATKFIEHLNKFVVKDE